MSALKVSDWQARIMVVKNLERAFFGKQAGPVCRQRQAYQSSYQHRPPARLGIPPFNQPNFYEIRREGLQPIFLKIARVDLTNCSQLNKKKSEEQTSRNPKSETHIGQPSEIRNPAKSKTHPILKG